MIACPLVIYGFVEEKRLTDMSYKICVMKVGIDYLKLSRWLMSLGVLQAGSVSSE